MGDGGRLKTDDIRPDRRYRWRAGDLVTYAVLVKLPGDTRYENRKGIVCRRWMGKDDHPVYAIYPQMWDGGTRALRIRKETEIDGP